MLDVGSTEYGVDRRKLYVSSFIIRLRLHSTIFVADIVLILSRDNGYVAAFIVSKCQSHGPFNFPILQKPVSVFFLIVQTFFLPLCISRICFELA